MRWLKLLLTIFSAHFRGRISPEEPSEIHFSVWLTDVDASIMNHATMMTVMEMGRMDLMVRSGFFGLARKEKWYFPARSISVQFIRPLKVFQKATLFTKVFHVDEKWMYIEQKIVRNDKVIAVCIVKGTVKKGKESIPPHVIAKELGFSMLPAEGQEVIDALTTNDEFVYRRLAAENHAIG